MLAPVPAVLIVTRAGVGVTLAFLIGLSLAITNAVFPPGRRAAAIAAYFGVGYAVATPLPAISGALAHAISWRACFFAVPLIAALGLLITWRYVPETVGSTRRLDLPGMALFAVTRGPEWMAWVDDLPSVTQSHLEQSELRHDGESTHGSSSIALPVRTSDGAPAVLKISFPELAPAAPIAYRCMRCWPSVPVALPKARQICHHSSDSPTPIRKAGTTSGRGLSSMRGPTAGSLRAVAVLTFVTAVGSPSSSAQRRPY